MHHEHAVTCECNLHIWLMMQTLVQADILKLIVYFFLIFGSVSDLLDYINPSRDAKVRDVVAGKRKSYITKVPGYSCLIKTTLTHHTAYDTREKLHQFLFMNLALN